MAEDAKKVVLDFVLPKFKGNKETSYISSTKTLKTLDEDLMALDVVGFIEKTVNLFSEHTTQICTKTHAPLFDREKAIKIRDTLSQVFNTVLETMDEEIKEYG